MITGKQYAEQAQSSKYDKLKYSQYDCQAFVEKVLNDCTGKSYNWKGSNDMWRNALSWKGTVGECIQIYGEIPVGAWVFMHSYDGGEVARGYHDNQGNASHVGIYCRPNETLSVRDSTKGTNRDGVGYRKLSDFNMVGLPKVIEYGTDPTPIITGKEEALKALEVLTKFVKGV